MLDKINIRMDPPIDAKNCFSVLNIPNTLITLMINYLKGCAQERMSSDELATRFSINQISTTNLTYMGPTKRADMLAKITLPKIKQKAINMFMQIGDYRAIDSKDLFDLFVENSDNTDCLNELIRKNRRKDLQTLLPVNPNKEQAQAFMTIIDKIYDSGFFHSNGFSVKSSVKNPAQARALINAKNSKHKEVQEGLLEKAKLSDSNLANLNDTNLKNFINEIGCIPFFTKYSSDNTMWGSILDRLDDIFIDHLFIYNRHAFADEANHKLLLRLAMNLHIRGYIDINNLIKTLTPEADVEVYEGCAVILNALADPVKGLDGASDKQKNKLYSISISKKMNLSRLTQALDGRRPDFNTSIKQDAQSVAQGITWVASSIGSWLSTAF